MNKFVGILIFCFLFAASANSHEHNVLLTAAVTKSHIAGNVYVYNMSNAKLHSPNCEWAEKCTKNCIYIDKKTLKDMFFVPCIVCGGGILEATNQE